MAEPVAHNTIGSELHRASDSHFYYLYLSIDIGEYNFSYLTSGTCHLLSSITQSIQAVYVDAYEYFLTMIFTVEVSLLRDRAAGARVIQVSAHVRLTCGGSNSSPMR